MAKEKRELIKKFKIVFTLLDLLINVDSDKTDKQSLKFTTPFNESRYNFCTNLKRKTSLVSNFL